jgi:hypothetical protein
MSGGYVEAPPRLAAEGSDLSLRHPDQEEVVDHIGMVLNYNAQVFMSIG